MRGRAGTTPPAARRVSSRAASFAGDDRLAKGAAFCLKGRMNPRALPALLLLVCFALTGCGDLPAPFWGNPGATARRLVQPLSPMLAVATPTNALLPEAAGQALATEIASALQDAEVPALARTPRPTDWQLITRADRRAETVIPVFAVRDPAGEEQGTVEGAPVPLSAWYGADARTLKTTAAEASPRIVALLGSIRVARDRADPNSLYNRPAKVMVAQVKGAPGDGNISLTRQMRDHLAKYGPLVLTSANGADFLVQGEVLVVPIANRQQRVEIQWYVRTATGDERGRVVQLNEIPAGTLDRFWGDIAVVVAAEAAAGINDVLLRQAGKEPARESAGATGK